MPKTTVRIEGAEELKRKLEALGREARGRTLETAAMSGAEVIRDLARTKAPGPYIEAEVAQSAEFAIEIEIGPDKEHWYYQFAETGASAHPIGPKNREALVLYGDKLPRLRWAVSHQGHAAAPFLRPALEDGKTAAIAAVGAELAIGIARVVGSGG